jgi:L-seryl-tRNA(Ser) seleniumtransferase
LGLVNRCTEDDLRRELEKGGVAAVVHVESHHAVQEGNLALSEVVALAQEFGVPAIVDGAAQDLRLRDLIGAGADLVLTSAHKYLASTTAGIVAGRKDLVEAVYLQNEGIGRPMKAGKEAIFGVMAALEYRLGEDIAAWTAEQDRKVRVILDGLEGIPGLALGVDPDPNGCPFSRARLTIDSKIAPHSAASLTSALAGGVPSVVVRSFETDEGILHLDAVEMDDDEIAVVCDRVRQLLTRKF